MEEEVAAAAQALVLPVADRLAEEAVVVEEAVGNVVTVACPRQDSPDHQAHLAHQETMGSQEDRDSRDKMHKHRHRRPAADACHNANSLRTDSQARLAHRDPLANPEALDSLRQAEGKDHLDRPDHPEMMDSPEAPANPDSLAHLAKSLRAHHSKDRLARPEPPANREAPDNLVSPETMDNPEDRDRPAMVGHPAHLDSQDSPEDRDNLEATEATVLAITAHRRVPPRDTRQRRWCRGAEKRRNEKEEMWEQHYASATILRNGNKIIIAQVFQ